MCGTYATGSVQPAHIAWLGTRDLHALLTQSALGALTQLTRDRSGEASCSMRIR